MQSIKNCSSSITDSCQIGSCCYLNSYLFISHLISPSPIFIITAPILTESPDWICFTELDSQFWRASSPSFSFPPLLLLNTYSSVIFPPQFSFSWPLTNPNAPALLPLTSALLTRSLASASPYYSYLLPTSVLVKLTALHLTFPPSTTHSPCLPSLPPSVCENIPPHPSISMVLWSTLFDRWTTSPYSHR